jgi:hypothetical protein
MGAAEAVAVARFGAPRVFVPDVNEREAERLRLAHLTRPPRRGRRGDGVSNLAGSAILGMMHFIVGVFVATN